MPLQLAYVSVTRTAEDRTVSFGGKRIGAYTDR